MKLIVMTNNLERIDQYIKNGCDGVIVGLEKFSTNFDNTFNINDIKLLKEKYPNIELFVSMNKNFFNDELPLVEKKLIELDKIKVNGVLFYDLAIVYLKKKNNLHIDLVWNQTHMVTNYNTCNYYYDLGIKYGFLATEITLDEINEIKNNTNMKLFAFAYGYPIMAHSRRMLLSNYYINRNKKYDGKTHHIFDDKNHFIVKEDETGTTILNDEIVNGTCLVTDSNVDYVVFADSMIDEDRTLTLINSISCLIKNKDKSYIKKIEDLIGCNTNFFFKKTIFVVKKNEKD